MLVGELRSILQPLRHDLLVVAQTGLREIALIGDDPDVDDAVLRLYANVPLDRLVDQIDGTPVDQLLKKAHGLSDRSLRKQIQSLERQVLSLKKQILTEKRRTGPRRR